MTLDEVFVILQQACTHVQQVKLLTRSKNVKSMPNKHFLKEKNKKEILRVVVKDTHLLYLSCVIW